MFESMMPHLIELRQRLAISILAVIIGFIISFIFYKPILDWITKPLEDALTQVKKEVESKDISKWKIKSQDKNISTKESILKEHSNSAKNLSLYLQKASNISKSINDKKFQELSINLEAASKEAKKLQENIDKLILLEANKSRPKKQFNGMITTHQVGGAFFVAMKVALYAGIFLAVPVILWQFWLFVAPGLYENEKKMVLPFIVGGTIMFIIGVLFAYYIVMPFGFQFLITFGAFLFTPLINIEDYIGFFFKIMLGFGIAFELPVVTYFLALLGLVTDKTLKNFFKYAIVLIFILAALLTPPDVLTQLLMALPLIILYLISILVAKMVNPYKEEDNDEDEIDDRDFKALEENSNG
ncbi:MAG: twin-arginine translocase subunit TatC [Epsilonproteobacteria bacterium]|nr:twin-arginine translocase subunit TatC [Campylobacterota bacterium]